MHTHPLFRSGCVSMGTWECSSQQVPVHARTSPTKDTSGSTIGDKLQCRSSCSGKLVRLQFSPPDSIEGNFLLLPREEVCMLWLSTSPRIVRIAHQPGIKQALLCSGVSFAVKPQQGLAMCNVWWHPAAAACSSRSMPRMHQTANRDSERVYQGSLHLVLSFADMLAGTHDQ